MKITSLVLLFSINILAAKFNTQDSVLINGYDPVSYQAQGKALKGSKKILHNYEGITIYFSSKENKELFIKKPKRYMPAYNGWCAYALAIDNGLVDVNPETFKVINGKTYLFYNTGDGWFSTNTLKKWNEKDDTSQVMKADKYWEKYL